MEQDNTPTSIDECVICLEVLTCNTHTLTCSHVFHYECFEKYVKHTQENKILNSNNKVSLTSISCPLCKKEQHIVNIHEKHNGKKYSIQLLGIAIFLFVLLIFVVLFQFGLLRLTS